MTFHMDVIKDCLATWVHLKILETLMSRPKAMSQRQLAHIMGIPRATLQRALRDLEGTGLIKPTKVGSAAYWNFDEQGYLFQTLEPILEGLKAIIPPRNYLAKLIRKTLKLPKGYRSILFGSTITGEDTSSSDIDLCILLPRKLKTPSGSLKKDLETLQDACREKFGKILSPVFINEKEILRHPDKELYRQIMEGVEI